MSLYHSFRKTGKKKEISNRPQSCPLGSDSRILYAHIKTGMQKSIPVLLAGTVKIDILNLNSRQAPNRLSDQLRAHIVNSQLRSGISEYNRLQGNA